MKLLILGPAFGVPSIDAECNAAVALLQLRVPGKYQIVPTHEQTHRLPYLIDGQVQLSGFKNIVRHLANKRIYDERRQLDTKAHTDSIAISSFIEANAPTLLDISLYVGFENFRHATRAAYSKILPWHANYIIPPQKRSAARARTDHLGISSIDVDNVHEDMSNRPPGMDGVGKEPGFEAETQQRASLLLPRKETVRSLLRRPEHAAVFKLHALAENFFEPLQDILGDNAYLLDTEDPTAVDCFLYGHLALMLYPHLPQNWLESNLRNKYKKLAAYTERIHKLLGLSTNTDNVVALTECHSGAEFKSKRQAHGLSLPWQAPVTASLSTAIPQIRHAIWEHIPIIGSHNRLQLMDSRSFPFLERNLSFILLGLVASLVTTGYAALRTGLVVWPHGEETHFFGKKRFGDYGHLGAALAGIGIAQRRTP